MGRDMFKLCGLLVLLLSVTVAAVVPCGFAGPHPYSAIAQIQVGGGQGSGTLIAISDGKALVLSCRHVAQSAGAGCKLSWLGAGNQVTSGDVLTVVPGSTFNDDLSLIVCDSPEGVEPIVIAKFDPANGPWVGVGWRRGQFYETVCDEAEEKDGLIKFNAPLIGGMSGGALLDNNGHVVGVTVGSDMSTYGVAADGLYLQHVVSKYAR